MKKLALAALLLSPFSAHAETDYSIRWAISGGLFSPMTHLEFQAELGPKYIPINGAMIDATEAHAAATGTCFRLTKGGIYCDFNALARSFSMETDSNLTGTIKERNSQGDVIGSALITLVSIK